MHHYLIEYKRSTISYYRFGKGLRPVICFHGYGESAGSYAFLESHCGELFTFYSIDLPFHGETMWREGQVCRKEDLKAIVEAVLVDPQKDASLGSNDSNPVVSQNETQMSTGDSIIEVSPNETQMGTGDSIVELSPNESNIVYRYTLMGFSLGGRIALTLFQSMPEKVEKIVLLAPDGLKVNFWYWLSTQTFIGNRLFAFTMKKPGWFFGFLKVLNKLGMVNASVFKFVNYYIGNPEVRNALYVRWTTMRKLKPHLKRIKSLIKSSATIVRLIYGKHDRIILPEVGKKFQKDIEEYCNIEVIDSGHQVLQGKYAGGIVAQLID